MKAKKFSAAALALALILSVVCAAPAFAAASVRSDTTLPFSIQPGASYTFKVTVSGSGAAPSFTVGNGSVLKVYPAGRKGGDYYFKVVAAGAPGSAAGVYTALPGQKPVRQTVVTIVAPPPVVPNVRGNTAGNTANWGLAAEQGGWIYYSNRDGGPDSYKPYKIRTDGTGKTKLCNDAAEYLNVVGDWVYYSQGAEQGKLYKIRTDGTGRTKLSDDDSDFVSVVDGWIYYIKSVTHEPRGEIYKIRTDGTGRTKLSDEVSLAINVEDGWIYTINVTNEFYKIRTDGTGWAKLSDEYGNRIVNADNINAIENGWIYYFDRGFAGGPAGGRASGYYKIRTDGTDQTRISDDFGESVNAADGWVYFSNYFDDGKLYKMRTDGANRTKLSDDDVGDINLADGWIYYLSYGGQIYRIRTDGTGRQLFA